MATKSSKTQTKRSKKDAVAAPIQYPVVTKGNHLTVTLHEDGQTQLEWDDQALLEEVRAAIASVQK